MSKYTKGPWMVRNGKIIEKCYNGFVIADVRGATEVTQDEANARLIAAAPELLEALKSVAARTGIPKSEADWLKMIEIVNHAIAKAEGKNGN
jgi:hypothetical protein